MHLSSNRLLYHLFDQWRGNVASLSCDGARITVSGSRQATISLSDVREAPSVISGWTGHELSVPVRGRARLLRIHSGEDIRVRRLAGEIEAGWCNALKAQVDEHHDVIAGVLRGLQALDAPTRYPAACGVDPILATATALEADLFYKVNERAHDADQARWMRRIRTFLSHPSGARAAAIARFETAELPRWSAFFDTIKKNPLT